MNLNEIAPDRYPKPAAAPSLTREQVVAELRAAIRRGDVLAPGDSGMKINEMYPQRYPAAAAVASKTRDEVRAETLEAIRTGDMLMPGDSGLKQNEVAPTLYARPRETRRAVAEASSHSWR